MINVVNEECEEVPGAGHQEQHQQVTSVTSSAAAATAGPVLEPTSPCINAKEMFIKPVFAPVKVIKHQIHSIRSDVIIASSASVPSPLAAADGKPRSHSLTEVASNMVTDVMKIE